MKQFIIVNICRVLRNLVEGNMLIFVANFAVSHQQKNVVGNEFRQVIRVNRKTPITQTLRV